MLNSPKAHFENPYLEEFEQLKARGYSFSSSNRCSLTSKYSWAVPNNEAIHYLVSLSPIVEVGAGTGYWAKLVKDAGGEVYAFDKEPYKNDWCSGEYQWSLVSPMDSISEVVNYSEYTLFLCWPPYDTSFAYDCLKAYRGDKLVYIGEGWGGCTGDDKFFDLLKEQWEEERQIDIPQFYGMRDYLTSYRRKKV